MNPFDETNSTLPGIYGTWNPMTYMKQMDNNDLSNIYNQGMLTEQQQKNDFTVADNPIKLRQGAANAAQTEAQTPGIVANSGMLQDKAQISRGTLQAQMDAELGKYKGQLTQQHFDALDKAGQMYGQVGAVLGSVPIPARQAMARKLLGDQYQDEFDSIPPEKLQDQMALMGEWATNASRKGQLQDEALDQKGENTARAAQIAADAKIAAAEKAAQARIEAAKLNSQRKPAESMSQYEARIRAAANAGDDPHAEAALAKLEGDKVKRAIAAAQIPDALKRELLNMPSDATPSPGIPGNQSPLSKLPPGTKDNMNGTYTLPDGRIVRVKK